MSHHIPQTPSDQENEDSGLSTIFIGRQQQLDLFEIFLNRWQHALAHTNTDDALITTAPSPSNKIQGLVVLLYGRGGFGKSTLLKHYRDIAQQEQRHLTISGIIDWEFAVEGKRSIFNPPPGQEVDASEYYKVLCWQLVTVLHKTPKEFKAYQTAINDVEKATKDAHNTLDGIQKDDRYSWLRGLTVEMLTSAVRTYVPGSKAILEDQKVIDATNAVAKLTQEQIGQLYTRLHNKLGSKFGNYLDPSLQLGLALGEDLRNFARNFPLLLFFDTYEEADEGDKLLRIVMAAAGKRVGWIIAGRDNLWAGAEQRERSLDVEYGYKELVPSERGLSINFNAGDVGAFTLSDIREYFALLRAKLAYQPPLPEVTEEQAKRILDVTQGVPLAVRIAAGLYVETADVDTITETIEGKREIVDQMVRRYLLHTRASQSERAPLLGLALLRRADTPIAVAAALGLTEGEAKTGYSSALSQLHRRYSFVFTEKEQPSLHQEVRHFLRLWLLEHRKQPDILAIIQPLKETLESALKNLEEHLTDSTLKERLQDDEWVGTYLDLTEQQFWLDPAEGVRYALPFMIAAAIYRRKMNRDVATTGKFFEKYIQQPYRDWWTWTTDSLIYRTSRNPSSKELVGLEALIKLAQQRCPSFPQPLPDYRQELEAALWWRLGESYVGKDDSKALEWYEQALTYLEKGAELREAMAQTCYELGKRYYDDKKYAESIIFMNRTTVLKPDYAWAYIVRGAAYNRFKEYRLAIQDYDHAITLDPNYATAYYNRGIAYSKLKEYQTAIQDFDQAIAFNPNYVLAYFNRGNVYHSLKQYQCAIKDYDQTIALDPNYALAYFNRGYTYDDLKEYRLALQDYNQAITLDPNNASTYVTRGYTYRNLKEYQQAIKDYDHAIALDPNYAFAYYIRGNAYRDRKEYQQAIKDYDHAIALDPKAGNAYYNSYYNRGLASLWLNDTSTAQTDFSRAYELDPKNINAAWMAVWAGMTIQRNETELALQLEKIASIDAQHYMSHVCRGVALGLRNKVKEGLAEMEQAIRLDPEGRVAFFWKGMLSLYYYQGASYCEEAIATIRHALALDLPPVLLTPLYWLERDRPAMFEQHVKPLLLEHGV